MRKIKLLSATALSVMLAFSANAVAAGSFDDASEEEIAKAVDCGVATVYRVAKQI